jgi:orotidine-5'-phosphate decarboxylase
MKLKEPPAIIPALDLPIGEAVELVKGLDSVEDKIAGYKISSLHALDCGLRAAVSELRVFTDLPIIYDHQKGATDIPAIAARQVELAADCGVNAFIGVPLGAGSKTLEGFVDACKDSDLLPIILLEMTHPNANDYLKEGAAKDIFEKASELGVNYFVAPGNKPEKLREYRNWVGDSYITSPGIGAQGGQAAEAVQAGTDYPIIGRAIYQAENPVAVIEEIYKGCKEGFSKR